MNSKSRHVIILLLVILLPLISAQMLPKQVASRIAKDRLRSGPIFLLDTRLILITQFSYENKWWKNMAKIHNKWFKGQLHNGKLIDLEFENGIDAQIKIRYYGKNIILRVPLRYDYTVKDLSNLLVVNEKENFKMVVPISDYDKMNLPEHTPDSPFQEYKNMFIYPVCCDPNENMTENEFCLKMTEEDIKEGLRIPVHDVRHHEYNKTPFKEMDIHRLPYYNDQICPMIELDDDFNVEMLKDGQILVDKFPQLGLACIDWVKTANGRCVERAFGCVDDFANSSGNILHWHQYYLNFNVFIVLVIVLFLTDKI